MKTQGSFNVIAKTYVNELEKAKQNLNRAKISIYPG